MWSQNFYSNLRHVYQLSGISVSAGVSAQTWTYMGQNKLNHSKWCRLMHENSAPFATIQKHGRSTRDKNDTSPFVGIRNLYAWCSKIICHQSNVFWEQLFNAVQLLFSSFILDHIYKATNPACYFSFLRLFGWTWAENSH